MFKRNLLLLATCQGLMLSCTSLTMATSALVGVVLAPTPALATLPLGLVLLGIGWNFLYIGGTTLLTEVYLPAEKGIIQGINEFLVFSATAFTALASGYLHHTLGWETLNRHTIPVVCFAAGLIVLLGWQRRQRQPQTA